MIDKILTFFKRSLNSADIRKKLIISALILAVFRFTAHVPAAGIDRTSLQALFQGSALLSLLDVFSGGTLANFSIMALGLTPYINASIIMNLMQYVVPQLEELTKEGEIGQEKINQYTRILTLPLAIFQGFGMYLLLQSQNIIPSLSPLGLLALVTTMTAGTMLAIWLGELMTEYGIGNGISVLIFAGIIARLPVTLGRSFVTFDQQDLLSSVMFLAMGVLIVGLIVYVNEAVRQIPIQHARAARRSIPSAQGSYIPLRVNQAGVIPIIFAVSLVLTPSLVGQFLSAINNPTAQSISRTMTNLFNPQSVVYNLFYFLLVVGFTYFYTAIVFNPEKIAENLQKSGSYIPGVRPGKQTINYLNYILNRVTLVGALFLGLIAVFPSVIQSFTGGANLIIGGTGILIVVAVVLEITREIESQLVMKRYDTLLRK